MKKQGFRKELEALIKEYSVESKNNNIDYVISRYIADCLKLLANWGAGQDNLYKALEKSDEQK